LEEKSSTIAKLKGRKSITLVPATKEETAAEKRQ